MPMTAETAQSAPAMSYRGAASTEMPKYRQMNPHGFFADDDTLYPEGAEFYWVGAPNEFMEPLNQPAVVAMEKYLTHLDECAAELAKKMGRPYMGRPRTFAADGRVNPEQFDIARDDATAIAAAKVAGKSPVTKIKATTRAKPVPQGHMAKRDRGMAKISGVKMPEPPPAGEKPVPILGSNFTEMLPNRG